MNLNQLRDAVHQTAVEKGWWDDEEPNVPEKIALIHSELSEALEEYRDPNAPGLFYFQNGVGGKPEGLAVELMDAVIRILDLCGYLGIDADWVLLEKHAFNTTRPRRHGGKRA